MVLLIDTNIVLDYLLKRGKDYDASRRIIVLCAESRVKGFLAFHSVSTLWYVMRKLDDKLRRTYMKQICKFFEVVGASHASVECALDNESFKDFEDCLQDKCAQAVHANYIITRNVADFVHSSVKAVTPEEFLTLYD